MNFAKLPKNAWIVVLLVLMFAGNLFLKTLFLDAPKSHVFDEAYYVKYSHSYQCRTPYNDLHPPLPKLLFHWASAAKECVPGLLENKTDDFEAHMDMIGRMRLLHAVLGSIVPLVIFLVAFQVSGSVIGAGLAAFWVSIENATVLQSSFVLLEQFLLLGIFGAALCYLRALRATTPLHVRLLALATGMFVGLAVGTKFTGLCAPAAMMVHFGFHLKREKAGFFYALPRLAFTMAGFLLVYLSAWMAHEQLLFPSVYQSMDAVTRINEGANRIVFHHWQMLTGHFSLGNSDPSGSRWYQWLVGMKPLLFWANGERWLTFFPNHLVWVGSVVFLFCCGWGAFLLRMHKNFARPAADRVGQIGLIAGIVFFNFVPNLFINRVLYMYQFVPALHGLVILNVWFLARFGLFNRPLTSPKRRLLACLVLFPLLSALFSSYFSHGKLMHGGEWRKRYYSPYSQQK